jgi:inner membrane protein
MVTAGRRVFPVRTPAFKFGLVVLLGVLLAAPLFSVYLLVYDRQTESTSAKAAIVAGWGEGQVLSGPFLVIPFTHVVQVSSNETDNKGHDSLVTHEERSEELLVIAPTQVAIDTRLEPELRKVAIYQAVIYTADVRIQGSFTLPDVTKLNIDPALLHLDQAQMAMGISAAKGLAGSQPVVIVDGRPVLPIPGSGLSWSAGNGFRSGLVSPPLQGRPMSFDMRFQLRGHDTIAVAPSAQDTQWHVSSPWPHPSFLGGFLPVSRTVTPHGFEADWRVGNLALNHPLASIGEQDLDSADQVSVALLDTVDVYSEVNRAVKYGFMFIGFTFMTLLLFDILLGASVPGPAYLLVGVGLILFFVLLLAFAEVIGFGRAYFGASGAIILLLSCYAAAILTSWRRAAVLAAMLAGLYGVLYVLLGLEAYSLLIGSLLVFVALATVMYFTRKVTWRHVDGSTERS